MTAEITPLPTMARLLAEWEQAESDAGHQAVLYQSAATALRVQIEQRLAGATPLREIDLGQSIRRLDEEDAKLDRAMLRVLWARTAAMEQARVAIGWCERHNEPGEWVPEAATRFCGRCQARWELHLEEERAASEEEAAILAAELREEQ